MSKQIEGMQVFPIAEVKKLGFDFSVYDYMANLRIGDITLKNCKVVGDYGFCVNDDETQVAIISLKQSKCKIEKIYLN